MKKINKNEVVERFNSIFPNPKCELNFSTPFQLLIAVILSAQCTDKRVNLVTSVLFEDYPDAYSLSKAKIADIEKIIYPCGFYHNKAKNIVSLSQILVNDFNGQVPGDPSVLVTLPGVGRKTANVVISEAFGGDAIAVDTHVLRVSNRLGFVKTNNPEVCESMLMKNFNQKDWSKLHLQMVHFGRYVCKSQNPNCNGCIFSDVCNYKSKK